MSRQRRDTTVTKVTDDDDDVRNVGESVERCSRISAVHVDSYDLSIEIAALKCTR